MQPCIQLYGIQSNFLLGWFPCNLLKPTLLGSQMMLGELFHTFSIQLFVRWENRHEVVRHSHKINGVFEHENINVFRSVWPKYLDFGLFEIDDSSNSEVQGMAGFTERFAMLSRVLVVLCAIVNGSVLPRASDPCAAIGGQKWVAPGAVRDCYSAIKVNETLKSNVSDFHQFSPAFSDTLAGRFSTSSAERWISILLWIIKFKRLHHLTTTSTRIFSRIWIGSGRRIMLVIMTCTLIFPELSRDLTMGIASGSTVAMWVPTQPLFGDYLLVILNYRIVCLLPYLTLRLTLK